VLLRSLLKPLLILVGLLLVMPVLAFRPVAAKHGMVVSSEPLASQAGVEILKKGGNAVDAAVATGFALAVTHPFAGNIGGGGFMLIRMADGRSALIDYREEAPGAATRNMYLDSQGNVVPDLSTVGALSTGVPGTVAGFALAERKYGRLGLGAVMQPAIRLAQDGFPVSYWLAQSLQDHEKLLSKFRESRRIYLRNGDPYQPGDMFRQPELASTLRLIAHDGPKVFYRGSIARKIVATIKKYNGIINREDLESYRAKVRKPLAGHFRGYEVLAPPPPSSGGVALIEMLNILDPMELGPPDCYQSIHLIAETMRRAYADRSAYLGDSDFVKVPVAGLTSPAYAAELRRQILASAPDEPIEAGNPAPFEKPETTHYSAADADGNVVSNTYTLNGGYGSGVTVAGAGFLLNDEMDDFTSKPGVPNMYGLIQSEANAIAPYKRMLSSMTPTIVLWNGKPVLVLGTPGGATIINTVLQVMLNVLVYKMDVREAVTAPRFHDQWMPDQLTLEKPGFSQDTVEKLRAAGYKVVFRDSIGECEAIEIDPGTGWRFGAADPRSDGRAVGY
jgi:gamma-glutamyltranspeptidase / glutathione hydrolase